MARTPVPQTPQTPAPRATTHSSFAAADGAMREVTPFGVALSTAKQITVENARRDQPKEWETLQAAMAKLDDQGRTSLFWLLVRGVVIDQEAVQPMFAVARQAGMVGAAYNAAAIARATREGNLTLTDLKNSGLVEVKFRTVNGREVPHFQPMVGHEKVESAAKQLRQTGKITAADVLDKHIRDSEKARLLGEAARARFQGGKSAPAETPATPTPDA